MGDTWRSEQIESQRQSIAAASEELKHLQDGGRVYRGYGYAPLRDVTAEAIVTLRARIDTSLQQIRLYEIG